ncbi:TetR family transcriptional regulator [uncultured Deinococcus sp.]|uniref:TetR family transcriptional regulator n=1 Tax=uncultured Deinococcus sp. TaxID=158789 RepID=UPI0025F6D2A5|nr:TetR family transcriptional regulator [uncultured Deinococcus sp.]
MTKRERLLSPTLRERTRELARAAIAEHAMTLFAEHGFEETTVDQIAVAAGISPRSFFRYFDTKEDVVMGDFPSYVRHIEAALRARPREEQALTAWRHAIDTLIRSTEGDVEGSLRTVRVMNSTASLRARHLEKHLSWAETLVPLVAERLPPGRIRREVSARAIVLCGLTCFDIALFAWAETDGKSSLGDILDLCMAQLQIP